MRTLLAYQLAGLLCASSSSMASDARQQSIRLADTKRARDVPVSIYFPEKEQPCLAQASCPVVLLSPGYGVPHTGYAFIADALTSNGYLVVAIQQDLSSDPPLARHGDLIAARTPAWERGVENLLFVQSELSRLHPGYAWSALTVIGHSNGGDISSLALRRHPDFARTLITLDNRRAPLPREANLRVLSIRGSDFPADPGVLPTAKEQSDTGACIVQIPNSRHDDMLDSGPVALRSRIVNIIVGFLQDKRCDV